MGAPPSPPCGPPAVPIFLRPAAAVAGAVAALGQQIYTFSLRSGEIVRTRGYSARDVLFRTMLRTRLSSRNFGGQPGWVLPGGAPAQAGFRRGRDGEADRQRRGRAMRHVARQLGVQYCRQSKMTTGRLQLERFVCTSRDPPFLSAARQFPLLEYHINFASFSGPIYIKVCENLTLY